MLPSVTTHSSFTKSVMMSVAVSEVGVVLCQVRSEKSIDNIGGLDILLYQQMLSVIKHVVDDNVICLSAIQLMLATQFNSCCPKLSTSFLLSYGPNKPEINSVNY